MWRVRSIVAAATLFGTILKQARPASNSNRKGRKVIFLVRRYHTNMIPMVRALQLAGHEVAMVCSQQEKIEDYELVEPILIENGFSTNAIASRIPFTPDLTIIRHKTAPMIEIMNWSIAHGATAIHYDQKPLRRAPRLKDMVQDLRRLRKMQIDGIPLSTITPVDHWNSLQNNWPKKFLTRKFNFPVDLPDQEASSRDPKSGKPSINVLMVGKMAQPRKRHLWLIDALTSANLDCSLTICGAGLDLQHDDGTRSTEYFNELKSRVEEINREGSFSIKLREFVPFKEMPTHYGIADIFVLPSTNEEFGISVFEAMASQCACVVTDTVGAAHHITHGKDGLLFEEANFKDFEAQVHLLLRDESKRLQIQLNARRTVEENHNLDQFAQFIASLG